MNQAIEIQYFPSIEFFYYGILHGTLILESCENYQKGGLRNRCFISTAQGKLGLSIPLVKGKNQQTPIKNVKIDFTSQWQKSHFRTIQTAYGNSPFFDHYVDLIEHCIFQKQTFLFDFNFEIIQKINKKLNLHIQYRETQFFEKKKTPPILQYPEYYQVFEERYGFISNLSILDLMLNVGNESKLYLKNIPAI